MGKGEIASYEQFLLFPQCFQKAYFPGASKGVVVWEWVKEGRWTQILILQKKLKLERQFENFTESIIFCCRLDPMSFFLKSLTLNGHLCLSLKNVLVFHMEFVYYVKLLKRQESTWWTVVTRKSKKKTWCWCHTSTLTYIWLGFIPVHNWTDLNFATYSMWTQFYYSFDGISLSVNE